MIIDGFPASPQIARFVTFTYAVITSGALFCVPEWWAVGLCANFPSLVVISGYFRSGITVWLFRVAMFGCGCAKRFALGEECLLTGLST